MADAADVVAGATLTQNVTAATSEFTLSLPSKVAAEALSGGETLEVSLPGGLLMGTSGLVPAQTLAITLADCRAPCGHDKVIE